MDSVKENLRYLEDNKEVAQVLAAGFGKICQEKPKFPVNYLARFLKNHNIQLQEEKKLKSKKQQNQKLIEKFQNLLQQQQKIIITKQQEQQKTQNHKRQLMQEITYDQMKSKIIPVNSSTPPNHYYEQFLSGKFCPKMVNLFNLASCYVGQLTYDTRKVDVNENDQEDSHLQLEKDKIIRFSYVSQGQQHVRNKKLPLDSVVGRIMSGSETQKEGENQQEAPDEREDGKRSDEIYFSSVVGNQELKFFSFPRLGAYYALSIPIKTYLHSSIFDSNLQKLQSYHSACQQHQKTLQQKEIKFRQQYQQKHSSGAEQAQLQQLQKQFQLQKQSLSKPIQEQFDFIQRKFIFCFDTLGKDCEIKEEIRKQLREVCEKFRNGWEGFEVELLARDIQRQLGMGVQNKQGDEEPVNITEQFAQLLDEEQKQIQQYQDVEKAKDNEKLYEYELNLQRIQKTKEYLLDEKYLPWWNHLCSLNVIKYHQVIKQFLIMLGYEKNAFSFPGTNQFDWPKTRQLLKKDKAKIQQYINTLNPKGSKPQLIKPYAKCSRIENNLEGFQPANLVAYNIYLALILRLVQLYTKTRLQDYEVRAIHRQQHNQNRQEKLKEAEQKAQQKEQKLAQVKQELQEKGELETFDEAVWNQQYDEENPPVQVPEALQAQIDRDLEDVVLKKQAPEE